MTEDDANLKAAVEKALKVPGKRKKLVEVTFKCSNPECKREIKKPINPTDPIISVRCPNSKCMREHSCRRRA